MALRVGSTDLVAAIGGTRVNVAVGDKLIIPASSALVPFARNDAQDFPLDATNTSPAGLWSDGITMWVTDTGLRKIFAYNLSTKARDASKDFNTLVAANANPAGITSDGNTMWVADLSTGVISAYSMTTKARDSSKDILQVVRSFGGPVDVWSNRTSLLTVYNPPVTRQDSVRAYSLPSRARDASKDLINTLASQNNVGIWSDGVTLWLADATLNAVKIFAYNLSTKARDASKDFNTLVAAGLTNLGAIWSDGTTIWVVSVTRVLAFNMPQNALTPTAPKWSDDTGDPVNWTVGAPITDLVVPAVDAGSPTPTYTATGLPDGVAFTPSTRTLSGTPTTAGTGTITITATNSAGSDTYTIAYTITAASMDDEYSLDMTLDRTFPGGTPAAGPNVGSQPTFVHDGDTYQIWQVIPNINPATVAGAGGRCRLQATIIGQAAQTVELSDFPDELELSHSGWTGSPWRFARPTSGITTAGGNRRVVDYTPVGRTPSTPAADGVAQGQTFTAKFIFKAS